LPGFRALGAFIVAKLPVLSGALGLYFLGIPNKLLRALGSGVDAFHLTRQIVVVDMYWRTRNPMSLGYYLGALALGFVTDSRFLTLVILWG